MEIKEELQSLTIEQISQVIDYIKDLNAHNPQKVLGHCA